MKKNYLSQRHTVGLLVAISLSSTAQADFTKDSHLDIAFKNFYLTRDFKNSDKVGSWSQGADAQFTSGYTDTPIQMGLDLDGQYAVRFSSQGDDGSLPYNPDTDETASNYGRAGATLKFNYSKTNLKIGDLRPMLPIAFYDPIRQLDTIFQGAVIESKEIENLTITSGRFWSAVTRDSSNHEKFYLYGSNKDLNSSGMNFIGTTYDVTPHTQLTYFFADVEDLYQQHYLGYTFHTDLSDGYTLQTDLRYFYNTEAGDAKGGDIDNRALSSGITLKKSGHSFSTTYQQMYGEDAFPTLNGYIPQLYLDNFSNQPFLLPKERSWSLGYEYDFTKLGLPGLTFRALHISGSNIVLAKNIPKASETESDIALKYVIQSGALKGVGAEWKSYQIRQKNFGDDFNENRLTLTYTWRLF